MSTERDSGNSLTRMLSILDLFTLEDSLWATNDILDALSLSRSTGYRYIRSMTSAGLLSAVGNGYYVLGPRIIELDLQIRETDPLLRAAEGVLEELSAATGQSALLCTLFQNSILCVKDYRVPTCPKGMLGRGQRRPLFRGALSKVILAYLSPHRLRTIFKRRHSEIIDAGLGEEWVDFRNNMSKIRSEAFVISSGEFSQGVSGCGAAVFNGEGEVIGSVGVAFHAELWAELDRQTIVDAVTHAGREISNHMAHKAKEQVLRPRAVG